MLLRAGLFGTLLLAVLPTILEAQTQNCRQVLPSDARRLVNSRGQEIIYFRDPVRVLCTGGLRLEADSAIMNRATASVQLVDNVVYRDSVRQLTADWANYIGERDQLLARGTVLLENLDDGSTVEGEQLDYLRATDTRPVSRMVVRGDRPHARIPPRPDTAGAADDPGDGAGAEARDSAVTDIWAERMEFEGEESFLAVGNVELRRGEMTGAGDSATFQQDDERMTLVGDAFVDTEEYRLEGSVIDAFLAGRELDVVRAEDNARIRSEQLTVEAERIRVGFLDGRLDRMEAWNPEPESVPRALADAEDFRLRADSIDARSDSLGLREVRAVGRAFGERNAEAAADSLQNVSRDWIQGDTILGFFSHPRRAAQDADTAPAAADPAPLVDTTVVRMDPAVTARAPGGEEDEVVLERIVVVGGGSPALSLYRMRTEGEERAAINFMKALRIILYLEGGDVTRVEADGPLDGLYLAPAGSTEEEAGDAVPTEQGGTAEGRARP